MLEGKKKARENLRGWIHECGPYVVSAITNGQWQQARRNKLPGSGGDMSCQLCGDMTGTVMHRHDCWTTKASAGWPALLGDCHRFNNKIGTECANIMKTPATCIVRPPVPVQQERNDWVSHGSQPDVMDDSFTLVIDSSKRDWRQWHNATTGCGLAILRRNGELAACAQARPPPWIKTANAAEAWALYLILSICPWPPVVLPDCMALLRAARAGAVAATSCRRPAARVWKLIAHALDGYLTVLTRNRRFTWLPAH